MNNSNIGFAIGNGYSREHFDLRKLKELGTTVGCNYIIKDFEPDVVVSLDAKPRIDFLSIINREWKWLTLRPEDQYATLDGENILPVSLLDVFYPKHNSGVIACTYLAEVLKPKRVYLIGFDFFRIHPDMVRNELYTPGLRKFRDFDTAFCKLAMYYPNTEFIRVGPVHPHDVKYFMGMREKITFQSFLEFEVNIATDTL